MKILVINAGSSSLKYQLFDMDNETVLAKGLCERIGIDGHLKHTPLVEGKSVFNEEIPMPTHAEAIAAVMDKLTSSEYGVVSSMHEIGAVGHRIVHGGEYFSSSVVITDEVLKLIEACSPFAPLHNPAHITGIKACMEVLGKDVPEVAVFDTSFHQTMPPKAFIYAIHDDDLKLITCHMGNGSSICAVKGGKSIDTSMGFTPLVGLPMGTRCGQMDMGAVQYIMHKHNLNIDAMLEILNKKSGVLGVSGVSSDFRDLEAAMAEGNKRAELALDLFHYWVAKTIGGYVAAMNGVDGIVFTAGVGENSAETRKAVCEYLGYLGCAIDDEANSLHGTERFISTPDSRVKLMVVPTNEELVIARDTKALVG